MVAPFPDSAARVTSTVHTEWRADVGGPPINALGDAACAEDFVCIAAGRLVSIVSP
jgi:hypothetical protein